MRAVLMVLSLIALLSGCASPAITAALGVGGGMAVSHEMNGHACQTFTASLPKVRNDILTALGRMDIKPDKAEKMAGGETILARANQRSIRIELEALSPHTTRVEAVARTSTGFVDAATALEIVRQVQIAARQSGTMNEREAIARSSLLFR